MPRSYSFALCAKTTKHKRKPKNNCYVPARKEARCSVLPVEATWNLLLTPGAVVAVVDETFLFLSVPVALFLLLHVVSVLRRSD